VQWKRCFVAMTQSHQSRKLLQVNSRFFFPF